MVGASSKAFRRRAAAGRQAGRRVRSMPPADAASVGDVGRIDLNVGGGVGEAEHVGVSGPLELRGHEAVLVQLLVSGTKCKVQSARSESRMNMRTRWLD